MAHIIWERGEWGRQSRYAKVKTFNSVFVFIPTYTLTHTYFISPRKTRKNSGAIYILCRSVAQEVDYSMTCPLSCSMCIHSIKKGHFLLTPLLLHCLWPLQRWLFHVNYVMQYDALGEGWDKHDPSVVLIIPHPMVLYQVHPRLSGILSPPASEFI